MLYRNLYEQDRGSHNSILIAREIKETKHFDASWENLKKQNKNVDIIYEEKGGKLKKELFISGNKVSTYI